MRAAVLEKPYVLSYKDIPKPVSDDEFMVMEVKACSIHWEKKSPTPRD